MAIPAESLPEKSKDEAAVRRARQESSSVPAHIASRYLVERDRYHFPDQQPAFVDRGSRFTVQTQNSAVLKDLITIAQARGWQGIQVGGTRAFRREAWAAATAAGLKVQGYTPSALERQAAERSRARAVTDSPTQTVGSAQAISATNEGARGAPASARTRSQAAAEAIRSAATTREELQLKFPEVSEAVFKRLDSHEEFANAFVRAGLVREADRQQVISLMRERLAAQLARGQSPKSPSDERVRTLIARAVGRAGADLGANRAPAAQALPPRDLSPPEQGRGGR